MEANLYDPRLKTHALAGTFTGFHATSCGYDCRIVFALRLDPKGHLEQIILINGGTHDEVY